MSGRRPASRVSDDRDQGSLSPAGSECSTSTTLSHADRKKETHLRCERQRREAINNGYAELKELIPSSMATLGCKTTNAAVLFRACDYINQLKSDLDEDTKNVESLKAKISALQMISEQYESMSNEVPQDNTIQTQMLQSLMDGCYDSFARHVNTTDYATITRTVIPWIENLSQETQPVFNNIVAMPFKHARHE